MPLASSFWEGQSGQAAGRAASRAGASGPKSHSVSSQRGPWAAAASNGSRNSRAPAASRSPASMTSLSPWGRMVRSGAAQTARARHMARAFSGRRGRDGDPVALRQKQSVQQGVEHLAVVHGALLPLDAVGQDGMAEVLLQAAEGQRLPIGPAQPQPDQKQPVGLDGPPVAQPLERPVGQGQVGPVGGQALVDAAAQGLRRRRPEQDEGPQPVFGAQAGFQRPPGGVLAGGGAGHAVQPVLQQGNKVKVSIRFRGREMAHVQQSKHILDDFAEALADIAVVEKPAKMEGRAMSMVLTEKR